MSLPSPNLDDRTFQQLLDESIVRVKKSCPQWSDLSPGDPGMALLELFAFLTETMIYRLNRVPEKAYIEFLRLMGVTLLPPAAAGVQLRFSLKNPQSRALEIPRGTRVTIQRAASGKELPIFTTVEDASIPAGRTEAFPVVAHHAEWVQGELAGKATGLPGASVTVKRPPIIAKIAQGMDLVVGVEALPGELDERVPARKAEGKTFRVWHEVEAFSNLSGDRFVYMADRASGLVTFAPALYKKQTDRKLETQPKALAEIPPAGREIRLWYLRGGGVEGDLSPNTLTVLKDSIAELEVTNPEAATGGSAVESLANALIRGPLELHTLHRAVTARDFEAIALRHSRSVARARAFTKAALWKHAKAGTVELLLVPSFPKLSDIGWKVTAAQLQEKQTQEARDNLSNLLDERRPLGTVCLVNWVRYKTVRVKARIVCHREEDRERAKERVLQRLYQTISPLPATPGATGWRFGQSLGAFHVYEIILGEPGVKFVDQVRLLVDEVPDHEITAIAADPTQEGVWYTSAREQMFRSVNDAAGWEFMRGFPGQRGRAIRTHPRLPGLVAICTQYINNDPGSCVWLSEDCGESWRQPTPTAFTIDDMAWIIRPAGPALLMATDAGLYELPAREHAGGPVQIIVDPKKQDRGFYAVAVCADVRGKDCVAVAARSSEGVWLSRSNGEAHSFEHIGLRGKEAGVLEAQSEGALRFLWAGTLVPGFEEGDGCFCYDLMNPADWRVYSGGWSGGSCRAIAFRGSQVLAATDQSGVLWTDATKDPATVSWEKPSVKCGLPPQETGDFQPVAALAIGSTNGAIVAGGAEGLFRSADGGQTYAKCSNREFVDKLPLPDTWLFCSGEHDIESLSEDEASGH